jgi:hypothetical protein
MKFIKAILSNRMIWTELVTRMDEMRNAYKILVGKPGRKKTLERFRCKWKDDIKVNLMGKGCKVN